MRFNAKVTSDRFDRKLGRVVCFGCSPVLFTCGVIALERVHATPAEFVIGILATSAAAFSMVVMGCVVNRRQPAA